MIGAEVGRPHPCLSPRRGGEFQRVNLIVVVEEAGHPQVTLIAGDGIEVIHRLVEAAKLVTNHLLASLFAERF